MRSRGRIDILHPLNTSCRETSVLEAWSLLNDHGSRRPFSKRSLHLRKQSSTPCDLPANVLFSDISSNHLIRSGETVTDNFSLVFIRYDKMGWNLIYSSVIMWDATGAYPVGATTNMRCFHNLTERALKSASFLTVLSSKTRDAPRMGCEIPLCACPTPRQKGWSKDRRKTAG